MREYENFLQKAVKHISPVLSEVGLFYNKELEKFIGFNDYEVLLVEFESFLTDTIIAINFHRYTNCFDDEYKFTLPNKNNVYGHRYIYYDHWTYYPEGTVKKSKDVFEAQIDMIIPEMIQAIQKFLLPQILTKYPIDHYLIKLYNQKCDNQAMSNHDDDFTFSDEWQHMQSDDKLENWSYFDSDEMYAFVQKKCEEILPFKDFQQNMIQRSGVNKLLHLEYVKNYLGDKRDMVNPLLHYYTIKEFLDTAVGQYLEKSLNKLDFEKKDSPSSEAKNFAIFYNDKLKIELDISVNRGIFWYVSYSALNKYGLLTVRDFTCENAKKFQIGCLIKTESGKGNVDFVLELFKNDLESKG